MRDRFAASDVARRIFGQPASTLDLARVLREPGVLLVDLAAGVIGQETAALIGSVLLNWIASLAFANAGGQGGDGNAPRRRIWLVVDEFQSFPGADFAFMLSELAKHGVQLVMGTQSLKLIEQASPKTRAAWLANTSTLFVFRCCAEDAEVLAGELGVSAPDRLSVTLEDIVGLPDFACYMRVSARKTCGARQRTAGRTHARAGRWPAVWHPAGGAADTGRHRRAARDAERRTR